MWLFEECRRYWAAQDGHLPPVPDLLAAMTAAPAFVAGFDVDHADLALPGQTPETIARHLAGSWDGARGSMVRAIFESLVCQVARRSAELDGLSGRERPTLHVVGGASRIDVLMQWLADATGKRVVAGPVEATAMGNACVQWVASGVMSGIDEARTAVAGMPEVRIFEPRDSQAGWKALSERIEEGSR
jgi:rhamnulokinase